MSIGTGALFFDCSSSGFGIVPRTAAPPRNWRPPPAGTSGAGHRYQLAASGGISGGGSGAGRKMGKWEKGVSTASDDGVRGGGPHPRIRRAGVGHPLTLN